MRPRLEGVVVAVVVADSGGRVVAALGVGGAVSRWLEGVPYPCPLDVAEP